MVKFSVITWQKCENVPKCANLNKPIFSYIQIKFKSLLCDDPKSKVLEKQMEKLWWKQMMFSSFLSSSSVLWTFGETQSNETVFWTRFTSWNRAPGTRGLPQKSRWCFGCLSESHSPSERVYELQNTHTLQCVN